MREEADGGTRTCKQSPDCVIVYLAESEAGARKIHSKRNLTHCHVVHNKAYMNCCNLCVKKSPELEYSKINQSRYTPWRRLGEEEL
jgi:hypothetical protein